MSTLSRTTLPDRPLLLTSGLGVVKPAELQRRDRALLAIGLLLVCGAGKPLVRATRFRIMARRKRRICVELVLNLRIFSGGYRSERISSFASRNRPRSMGSTPHASPGQELVAQARALTLAAARNAMITTAACTGTLVERVRRRIEHHILVLTKFRAQRIARPARVQVRPGRPDRRRRLSAAQLSRCRFRPHASHGRKGRLEPKRRRPGCVLRSEPAAPGRAPKGEVESSGRCRRTRFAPQRLPRRPDPRTPRGIRGYERHLPPAEPLQTGRRGFGELDRRATGGATSPAAAEPPAASMPAGSRPGVRQARAAATKRAQRCAEARPRQQAALAPVPEARPRSETLDGRCRKVQRAMSFPNGWMGVLQCWLARKRRLGRLRCTGRNRRGNRAHDASSDRSGSDAIGARGVVAAC